MPPTSPVCGGHRKGMPSNDVVLYADDLRMYVNSSQSDRMIGSSNIIYRARE